MMVLQVIAGFILLLGGAEVLVRGSVALAQRFGVTPLVIGMTVIAFGTSAPELVVSVNAALSGAPGLALGNVVGSNIANVWLIVGAAALVKPFAQPRGDLKFESVVLAVGTVLFIALALRGVIDLSPGLILLVAFFGFLGGSYWRETRRGGAAADLHAQEVEEYTGLPDSAWVVWGAVLGGLAGILIGSELLVDGGVAIARAFAVPEEVIGLTLIALGTSLPELAASAMAAWRGHPGVAVGNVVGSNLFNMLGVAGAAAVVAPLPVAPQMVAFDLWVMLGATVLLMPFLAGGWRMGRGPAIVFLAAYAAYIAVQSYGVTRLLPGLG